MTRCYSTVLSNSQVLRLMALYDEGIGAAEATRRTGFDGGAVSRWYKKFFQGWAPQQLSMSPTQESTFYAPVEKRAVPAPNAMPWATPARLMGRRA